MIPEAQTIIAQLSVPMVGVGGGLQISQLGGFPQPVLPKGEMPGHTLAYNESRRASGMFRHALGIRSVLP